VSQSAVTGNYGGFWGDVAARSFQPPGFDQNQIASRPVGEPVIPVVPGEQHLGHGQYMHPAAVTRPDVKPNVTMTRDRKRLTSLDRQLSPGPRPGREQCRQAMELLDEVPMPKR